MAKLKELHIIKKDGTLEDFDIQKVIKAISLSAERVMVSLSDEELKKFCDGVEKKTLEIAKERDTDKIEVADMHRIVESNLDAINKSVAQSYRDYRNYKIGFVHMMDNVFKDAQKIMYLGDVDNANTDSALVSTRRSLIYNSLNKELYKKFFLRVDELQAVRDGYIYIHDISARRDTMNCFGRKTRFITSDGVKSFEDFEDGQEVYVISHTGKWRKATVHNYGRQKLHKIHLKRNGRSVPIEIECTSNHRWILKDGKETTSLKVGDKLLKTPVIAEIDWNTMDSNEKLLWCMGFILADGSNIEENKAKNERWAHTCMNLRLCGDKNRYSDRFEECGFKVSKQPSLNGDTTVRSYEHLKGIPDDLDYTNMKYFIDGFLCADGHKKYKKGTKEVDDLNPFKGCFVTGDLNDKIYDMLNVAGYYVSSIEDHTGEETNFGVRTGVSKCYRFVRNQTQVNWRVLDMSDDFYEDDVWCLDVEVDHSFLLEHGIVTGNCCLCDISSILDGGFEMANQWYNEPKSLDTAFDVIGDVVLSAASQQYGGFTVPQIDQVLYKYAKMSYDKYIDEAMSLYDDVLDGNKDSKTVKKLEKKAKEYADKKIRRDFEQGFQGWEYKFNTVASSRGDYPFITLTFGLGTRDLERMASIEACKVRAEGQGKPGFKRMVLFPKLVFLEDKRIHGPRKVARDVYKAAIECSAKAMYPDWLSLEPGSYVGDIYQKYGKVVSPMGCRAFLSPWYKRGGMEPADDKDEPVFIGRFNLGVISLNLPMILAKAQQENKDFYEVLDYYMEMSRGLHKRTYEYLAEMRASTNPLMYCQGGFYGGHLKPNDKIRPILKPCTLSFGFTALNELQELYNNKSLVEDGAFALEVMEHINKKLTEYKKADGLLYAIYGTPAESLCGTQLRQFRAKYGIIPKVSDREYFTNSFHCHVTEDITPTEKQDLEKRFWDLANGGKIQYVRYRNEKNIKSFMTLIDRAMNMGFYEGVNMDKDYCGKCGHTGIDFKDGKCPVCGSDDVVEVNRVCGYLGYSKVHGKSRMNAAKMNEVKDRKSM